MKTSILMSAIAIGACASSPAYDPISTGIYVGQISQTWIDQQRREGHVIANNTAKLSGILELVDDCVVTRDDPARGIIIAASYRLTSKNGRVGILDPSRNVFVGIGDAFTAVGGEADFVPQNLETPPPPHCQRDSYLSIQSALAKE